jgi:cyclic lactone autoinducer peptide
MKSKLLSLVSMLAILVGLVSCNSSTTVSTGTYYQPQWYYNCYYDYDVYGYYYEYCVWEYYNSNGEVEVSKDIVADVADKEAFALEKAGEFYADKFNLSVDKGMKLAKTIKDFNALSERSAADVAEFAEKLYGVNPNALVSAVGSAQVGNNAELDAIIETSAESFNTSTENMKDIVEYLHGKALSENGISL